MGITLGPPASCDTRGMRPRRKDPQRDTNRVFPTRSHSWSEVGLARHVNRAAVKRARLQTVVLLPFAVAVLLAYSHRHQLFPGFGTAMRAETVAVPLAIGRALARSAPTSPGPGKF